MGMTNGLSEHLHLTPNIRKANKFGVRNLFVRSQV